ncbi:IDEAL domain-containing protein [Alicyclobacillaceae bacterium I2511]|nr:IDEAL domain-containing protein [Alicyclobacillaceae bacterium I2511]
MVAKEDLLLLKTKILPVGAGSVLDFLAVRHHQVEITHIVLENVPLLIMGRHGMIARIPNNGSMQKISQPADILKGLREFFTRQDLLYLFINLPDLPVPTEVVQVLEEIQQRHAKRQMLLDTIDRALDQHDKNAFLQASAELKKLMYETWPSMKGRRLF